MASAGHGLGGDGEDGRAAVTLADFAGRCSIVREVDVLTAAWGNPCPRIDPRNRVAVPW